MPEPVPELSELVPGLTPGVFSDYREEAKLFVALRAGLVTLSGAARALGISHPELEQKYAYWLTAPVCPACGERCLNFLCPECMQHNDMPWVCDACKARG